jgi:WD40 repeat protein
LLNPTSHRGGFGGHAIAVWKARLWDVETGRELRSFEGHGVALSPDGRRALASVRHDGSLTLWDLETGKELCRFANVKAMPVAFLPDGRRALSSAEGKTLRLWQLPAPGK